MDIIKGNSNRFTMNNQIFVFGIQKILRYSSSILKDSDTDVNTSKLNFNKIFITYY